jgi:2-amino-4-hydroxy-6-hydroxymethyldihydropteridine diphosphokinase
VLQNSACGAYFKSPFHNQLLLLKSSQGSKQLKKTFEQLEIQLGREEKSPERKYKDRTIDIDILSQACSPLDALAIPLPEPYNQRLMNEWQLPAFS